MVSQASAHQKYRNLPQGMRFSKGQAPQFITQNRQSFTLLSQRVALILLLLIIKQLLLLEFLQNFQSPLPIQLIYPLENLQIHLFLLPFMVLHILPTRRVLRFPQY
jgi:hypothetical protein